jgi:hypothetical protein
LPKGGLLFLEYAIKHCFFGNYSSKNISSPRLKIKFAQIFANASAKPTKTSEEPFF